MALDTETTGLKYREDKPFGYSFSLPDGQDFYFDLRHHPQSKQYLADLLSHMAKDPNRLIIFHNAPFDVIMLDTYGIQVPLANVRDTQVNACLLNEHEVSFSLDALCKKYLGHKKVDEIYEQLAELFGGRATRNVQMPNLHRAPPEMVAPYAKMDTRLTLELYDYQMQWLDKQAEQDDDILRVFEFENRLIPYFIRNMLRGVRVDVQKAELAQRELTVKINGLQTSLDGMAGFKCNPNPSGDIHKLFEPKQDKNGVWFANDGTPLQSTPAGKPSIGADALRDMKHPAAKTILQIRKYTRVRDTFLGGHVLGHQVNGRVYPHINQTKGESGGTGTGRLSYASPALQQMSKRDKELAAIVRDVFLPDEGCLWGTRDWSQTDFRFMAHYTKVPKLMQAYAADPRTDFHFICAEMTGVPRDAPFAGGANAKQINLGLVFGMGEGKLASEMGLPFTVEEAVFRGERRQFLKAGPEAKGIFTMYHREIPGIRQFLKTAERVAKSRGYVKSIHGRRIRFPGGNFVHKAGGLIFQAATAELMKYKYAEVSDYLDSVGGSVVLSVHDELNNNLPIDRAQEIDREVAAIMEDYSFSRVPMLTSGGIGKTWYDAMKNEV